MKEKNNYSPIKRILKSKQMKLVEKEVKSRYKSEYPAFKKLSDHDFYKMIKNDIEIDELKEIKRDARLKVNDEFESGTKKVLLGMTVVAASIGLAIVAHNLLPSGDEGRDNSVEQTSEVSQSENSDIRSTIKVKTEKEQMEEEIKNKVNELDTKDEVLTYVKEKYLEEYEKFTGDSTLQVDDLSIIYSPNDYIYRTDDNQLVTHTSHPEDVESTFKRNNVETTTIENPIVYIVKDLKNGKKIDIMAKVSDGNKYGVFPAVDGEKYEENKDKETVFTTSNTMRDVVEKGMELYAGICNLDYAKEEGKSDQEMYELRVEWAKDDLSEAVIAYENEKNGQIQDAQIANTEYQQENEGWAKE